MTDIRLVYGIIESPSAALARQAASPAETGGLGPMSARILHGTPAFRLNSPGWANAAPDVIQTVSGTEALVDYCRTRLLGRVSIFSLVLRSFIAAYIDFAVAEVERRREELDARLREAGLSGEDGLATYREWVFSVLLPLPQCHIAVPPPHDPADQVSVDVLFWTGRRALALTMAGRTMPTPCRRRALESLASAHPALKLASMNVPDDGRSWVFDEDFLELLGEDFLPGTGLPFGPYRVLVAEPSGGEAGDGSQARQ